MTLYQILPAESLPDPPSLPNSAIPPASSVGATEPTSAPISTVPLVSGRIELSLTDWPRLGSPQAPNTIALLLDPTCHDCRHLYRLMRLSLSQHRTNVAYLIIPVPLDPACNPAVLPAARSHPVACAYTRLSLALWQTHP
ncbi:MAG: DsbA family protein [Phycisphaerae bacterium]